VAHTSGQIVTKEKERAAMSEGSTHLLAAHETNVERHALSPISRYIPFIQLMKVPQDAKHLRLLRVEFIKDSARFVQAS